MTDRLTKLRIGITLGDYNGIGPELIFKSLNNDLILNYCTPIVYGSPFIFKYYAQMFDSSPLVFNIVKKVSDIKTNMLNIRVCSDERLVIEPGVPSEQSSRVAVAALSLAVQDIKDGFIDNIVTAPIDKSMMNKVGFNFVGHTEFFGDAFKSDPLMILMEGDFRVAMVTGHTSLADVKSVLTTDVVLEKLQKLNKTLQTDFNCNIPKIAVLGLNPHAGDKGVMGNEETSIILPAIKEARLQGLMVFGPYPADGFFGSGNENNFDLILGMYHDQVLIPFKQMFFSSGVNFTANLPIVRTSPDHGTAFDIAGKNIADISSFVNALFAIGKIHRTRLMNYTIKRDSLGFINHKLEKFSIGVPKLN